MLMVHAVRLVHASRKAPAIALAILHAQNRAFHVTLSRRPRSHFTRESRVITVVRARAGVADRRWCQWERR